MPSCVSFFQGAAQLGLSGWYEAPAQRNSIRRHFLPFVVPHPFPNHRAISAALAWILPFRSALESTKMEKHHVRKL